MNATLALSTRYAWKCALLRHHLALARGDAEEATQQYVIAVALYAGRVATA